MREIGLKGFEGKYNVRDNGEIINLHTGKSICQWIDNVGYLQVSLLYNNKKYYRRVHRLIAESFIDNPTKLPQVNHINGDKRDCNYNNLEWINNKDNTQHGYDNGLYHSKRRKIQIEVYDKQGNYINTYESIRQTAEQLNINRKTLSRILFDNKTNNYDYDFKAII